MSKTHEADLRDDLLSDLWRLKSKHGLAHRGAVNRIGTSHLRRHTYSAIRFDLVQVDDRGLLQHAKMYRLAHLCSQPAKIGMHARSQIDLFDSPVAQLIKLQTETKAVLRSALDQGTP